MQSGVLNRRARQFLRQPQRFWFRGRIRSGEDIKRARAFLISPLKGILSSVLLHLQKFLALAPVDETTDVVEKPVSTTSTIPSPVFKIFDFEKINYRADVLDAEHSAQDIRLTHPEHVEKMRVMVRGAGG